MTDDLERAEVPTLIEQYVDSAVKHGRASQVGRHEDANAAYEVLARAYRELRRRGPQAQDLLRPLLAHPDPFVRAWAGAHALEFAPEEGEATLRALADTDPGLAGFDAKITLDEWRAGRLHLP